jgi:ADP-heptose:LPS heptosyltransferase
MIFGEESDREACAQIAGAIGSSAVDLSGQTSLRQFVGLVARCDLVVSNDGGPLHIAASQDVPTVSIFGPVDPHVYGPYPGDPTRHKVIRMDGLPCRPCYHRFKLPPCPYERACLTTISSEEVIEACTMVLEAADTRAVHG